MIYMLAWKRGTGPVLSVADPASEQHWCCYSCYVNKYRCCVSDAASYRTFTSSHLRKMPKEKNRWRAGVGCINKHLEAKWAGDLILVMLRDLWSFGVEDSGGFFRSPEFNNFR